MGSAEGGQHCPPPAPGPKPGPTAPCNVAQQGVMPPAVEDLHFPEAEGAERAAMLLALPVVLAEAGPALVILTQPFKNAQPRAAHCQSHRKVCIFFSGQFAPPCPCIFVF